MLETLRENLMFVVVSGLIVAVIALAAKFSERYFKDLHKVRPARRITIIAICGAIAAVLHMLDFPCCSWLRNFTNWTSPNCR